MIAKLFFQPPIINNYYNVQPPYYSNPSYYLGLKSTPLMLQDLAKAIPIISGKGLTLLTENSF